MQDDIRVILSGGLSPRMRGNRLPVFLRRDDVGSIPAHAGEPFSRSFWSGFRRVYPRACGGTKRLKERSSRKNGLSPRMRGNRNASGVLLHPFGSIPAHAGEPETSLRGKKD